MCGLYGWDWASVGRPSIRARRDLAAMLTITNLPRGDHAWGWYGIDSAPHATIVSGTRARGVGAFPLSQAEDAAAHQTTMGHTRWATHGAVETENSHPFLVEHANGGRLVGMHNGVIWNHESLNRELGRIFPVDSLHALHALMGGEAEQAVCRGYGTLVWIELDGIGGVAPRPGVRLATWNGDLAVATGSFGVVWSSTPRALATALRAARLRADWVGGVDPRVVHMAHEGRFMATEERIAFAGRTGATAGPSWQDFGFH